MARKPKKVKSKTTKSLTTKRLKTALTQAHCQRLGFDYSDIAEADKHSGIGQNLFKYFEKHPKLRESYDRGRLLRALVKTAPNSLIYEAARRLKDLGFVQFQSAQDLRNFLDKDREANELWESARVNAAIENRENLRAAAKDGNVKAIELLDKWTVDRQKETGESGSANFNRISTEQMATIFSVSRQTVYEWNRDKGLPRNIDDTYDLYSSVRWYTDYIQKLATRGGNAVGSVSPKEQVKTELLKLELDRTRGEMIGRGVFIGWRCVILQNIVNAFNGITDLANRVFAQPREEIVGMLEDFRDDIMSKIQHVPAELKLPDEAANKLNEVYEIIKPQNTENRTQNTELTTVRLNSPQANEDQSTQNILATTRLSSPKSEVTEGTEK